MKLYPPPVSLQSGQPSASDLTFKSPFLPITSTKLYQGLCVLVIPLTVFIGPNQIFHCIRQNARRLVWPVRRQLLGKQWPGRDSFLGAASPSLLIAQSLPKNLKCSIDSPVLSPTQVQPKLKSHCQKVS